MNSGSGADAAIRREIDETFHAAVELHRQGQLAQAETLYKAVLSADSQHAHALHMLGLMANQVGDATVSVNLIRAAIAADPSVAPFHYNLGVSLQALQLNTDAVAAYRSATALDAGYQSAWENLGVALGDEGELDAAIDALETAESLNPESDVAALNLGSLLIRVGRYQDAHARFARVAHAQPGHGDAQLRYALSCLRQGDFANGWAGYDWRWHAETFLTDNPVRAWPFPLWDGAPLPDGSLLVVAEQGIGDEILFASWLDEVRARVGHVVVECDPRLTAIVERSFPGVVTLPRGGEREWRQDGPPVDRRVAAGSLPRLCAEDLSDIAARSAYLLPAPELVASFRERLVALGAARTLGVSWRGGTGVAATARSVDLARLMPVVADPDTAVIDLQYGDHADECAAFQAATPNRLISFDDVDPLRDMESFSALVAALDGVVSVDNSTVFVANAVGTPARVLLPVGADWRWTLDREPSPLCPLAQIHRQSRPGDWSEALDDLAAALRRPGASV